MVGKPDTRGRIPMTKDDDQAAQDFVVVAIDNLASKVLAFREWATDSFNTAEIKDWIEDITRLTEELDLIEYQLDTDTWGDEND
jgi:hypothetical protein